MVASDVQLAKVKSNSKENKSFFSSLGNLHYLDGDITERPAGPSMEVE